MMGPFSWSHHGVCLKSSDGGNAGAGEMGGGGVGGGEGGVKQRGSQLRKRLSDLTTESRALRAH